jgi:hypothetical protein
MVMHKNMKYCLEQIEQIEQWLKSITYKLKMFCFVPTCSVLFQLFQCSAVKNQFQVDSKQNFFALT